MDKTKQKKNRFSLIRRICFWLLMLITTVALIFLIADFILKGSLSFFVINALINHPVGQIVLQIGTKYIYSLLSNSHVWVNLLIIVIPLSLLILNLFVIKRLKIKASFRMMGHIVIYFFLSLFVIGFTTSQVYTDYSLHIVNQFLLVDDATTPDRETTVDDINNFNQIQKAVKNSKLIAQKVIDTVSLELKEEKEALVTLETGQYMEVAEAVALCFQIKGNVLSKEEHYLRNAFNRAPKDLETMLQDIKSKSSPYGWRLLPQGETVYHMQGENGAYNVKFVSEDGYHEAIYNQAGDLLTEENDPVNMGTFNYADPTGQPAMHAALDVLPYYSYGNCPASPKSSKENWAYQENPDVQKYWEALKQTVETLSQSNA